jgi:hypothetical protein
MDAEAQQIFLRARTLSTKPLLVFGELTYDKFTQRRRLPFFPVSQLQFANSSLVVRLRKYPLCRARHKWYFYT